MERFDSLSNSRKHTPSLLERAGVRPKKKPTPSDTVWVFEEEEGREEGLRQLYKE